LNATKDQATERTLFVSLLPKLSELTKRRNDAQKEGERIEREKQKCISRKGDAGRRLVEIGKEYSRLREERRALMLAGEDKKAEQIENDLDRLEREETRIKELQAGLERVIEECDKQFGPRATEALKVAERDIGTLELYAEYDRYNEAAEVLAAIVRGIVDKRRLLGLPAHNWRDAGVSPQDNTAGALRFIPRLRPPCDCAKDLAPVCPGHNPVRFSISHFYADTSEIPKEIYNADLI
jgi:hypothetical protein